MLALGVSHARWLPSARRWTDKLTTEAPRILAGTEALVAHLLGEQLAQQPNALSEASLLAINKALLDRAAQPGLARRTSLEEYALAGFG
jgi:hypothetical protein